MIFFLKLISLELRWCSWYVRISRQVHSTVHTNSAVCAATDTGEQLEGEGEAVYGIPVGDAKAVNAFGVDGGSAEHGEQAVRVAWRHRQFGITRDQCQNG